MWRLQNQAILRERQAQELLLGELWLWGEQGIPLKGLGWEGAEHSVHNIVNLIRNQAGFYTVLLVLLSVSLRT